MRERERRKGTVRGKRKARTLRALTPSGLERDSTRHLTPRVKSTTANVSLSRSFVANSPSPSPSHPPSQFPQKLSFIHPMSPLRVLRSLLSITPTDLFRPPSRPFLPYRRFFSSIHTGLLPRRVRQVELKAPLLCVSIPRMEFLLSIRPFFIAQLDHGLPRTF